MTYKSFGILAIVVAVVISVIATFLFVNENNILNKRHEAFLTANAALNDGNYEKAIVSVHRYFDLHVRYPNASNNSAALSLLDKAMSKWTLQNVSVEESRFEEFTKKFVEISQMVSNETR